MNTNVIPPRTLRVNRHISYRRDMLDALHETELPDIECEREGDSMASLNNSHSMKDIYDMSTIDIRTIVEDVSRPKSK